MQNPTKSIRKLLDNERFSSPSERHRRCVIMANLLRCYRHSGLVMYFSTLPPPSASAPCILAILTHLRVRVKICILTHPLAITTRQMTTFRDQVATEREYLNILCFKMNANNSEYHRNFAPPKQKGQRYSPTHPSIDMPRHKRCMHDACRIPLPIKRDMAQLIQSRFAKAWNRRKPGTGISL